MMIHIIINYNVIIKPYRSLTLPANRTYRNFLFSVLAYYITDVLWELLHSLLLLKLLFLETSVYFVIMALSVFLWTKYIIDYLNVKNPFIALLKYAGRFFFISQIIIIAVNFFTPIAFWFDKDGTYHTEKARSLNLAIQLFIFFVTAIYMNLWSVKSKGKQGRRYRTIGMFGLIMTVFVVLQGIYPLMPFYSIGYMLSTCLIHTFVLEDEKEAREQELNYLHQVEAIQEHELGSVRQMAFKDPLTGVKNKNAYIEDAAGIEKRIEDGMLKEFGVIVFDVNGLKTVNDTLGHDEGDKFIKKASKIICRQFKHSPIYRIGGDEFVAFLMSEDYKNRKTLLESFNSQIEKNKAEGSVTIASGLAEFDSTKKESYKALFEKADQIMYERKRELKEN